MLYNIVVHDTVTLKGMCVTSMIILEMIDDVLLAGVTIHD